MNVASPENSVIRLAAVGDLLLTALPGSSIPGRGLEALSDEIRDLFASCDIVFANLECTLPGSEMVPTEPRVISTDAQIRSLKNSGINVVTLGNNHAFDGLSEGFLRTRNLLKEMDIRWCGAGRDIAEAFRPVILTIKGLTLAFLGTVDASSGMHRFAADSKSGVAPNETEAVCNVIRTLRREADFLILSPHWGEERFRMPSPKQVSQAHSFVEAGAALVLGHHPHVLQGMEMYEGAAIVYSLGNFFASRVYWTNGEMLTWNRFERTGCILVAELSADGVDGEKIRLEKSGWGKRCLERANALLARGVTERRYRYEAVRVKTLLPVLSHLRWANLRRIHHWQIWKGLRR
jgi:poly-gamma-glutamate synthesis protein (capsule biosynthesis protein)